MQQIIQHWPDTATLDLPEEVSQDINRHLLLPFESEQEAIDFWKEAPSTLIILDHTDTLKSLQQDDTWTSIKFALTYPEYDVPLSNGYQMLVAITNDSGGGIYLVVPPELSHIITEAANHE
jgi:hypothetical protein